MALDTGTYISSLNASNPVHATDQVSQGDDHIRFTKAKILETWPNVTGECTSTHTEFNNLTGVTGTTGTGDLVLDDTPTIATPTLTGVVTATGSLAVTGVITGSIAASQVDGGTFVNDRISESSVRQHDGALAISESQITDLGTYLESGDTATTLNIGAGDTTLGRAAAGQLTVEGHAVIQHDNAAYISGQIFFSNTTEPTTEGSNGDIFLVY